MRSKDIPKPADSPKGPQDPESATTVEPSVLASTKQVSRRYGIPERTLEHMRYMGNGPPYVRLGPRCVRYRLSAVDRWLNERTVETTDA